MENYSEYNISFCSLCSECINSSLDESVSMNMLQGNCNTFYHIHKISPIILKVYSRFINSSQCIRFTNESRRNLRKNIYSYYGVLLKQVEQ